MFFVILIGVWILIAYIFQVISVLVDVDEKKIKTKKEFLHSLIPGYPLYRLYDKLE